MKYSSTIKIWALLIVVGFISTGCSYNIQKYGASIENVDKIKSIKSKLNVGNFTSEEKGQSSIACRAAGSVGTPDKSSFEQYIKSAFITELKLAGKFDPESQITISGHLEEIDFNSNLGTANWIFRLIAISNNSQSIVVNTKHEFSGSFVADKACSEVAQEFNPAVQKLIYDIVSHKDFNKLL